MRKKQLSRKIENDFNKDYESIQKGARNELSEVARDYLKAIVDTKNAKLVGIPTSIGGYPGRTKIERYRNQFEVSIGSLGIGYLALSLATMGDLSNTSMRQGPYSDSDNFLYTIGGYNQNLINTVNAPLTQGLQVSGWTQSPHKSVGVAASLGPNFTWRAVGATIEVYPTSSFADQNGRIVMAEIPNHGTLNSPLIGPFDLATIESWPTQRNIRAVQTGSQKDKIVLNYHPRSLQTGNDNNINDFEFKSLDVPSTDTHSQFPAVRDLIIVFFGKSGTQFHCDVTGMYEMKGISVADVKPRLVDSRGMDLVMNTFSHKIVDGYIGNPEHVYQSYLSNAWHYAKKGFGWVTRNEKRIMDGAGRVARTLGGFI